jgi:hypothetical protein
MTTNNQLYDGSTSKILGMEFPQAVSTHPIELVCDSARQFLMEKNRRYGNSALEPIQTFSKLSAVEGILQRIDDKISRIKNSKELRKNDVVDLLGYLVLLCVIKGWTNFNDQID